MVLFQKDEHLVIDCAVFFGIALAERNKAIVTIKRFKERIAVFHFQKHHLASNTFLRGTNLILGKLKKLYAPNAFPFGQCRILPDLGDKVGGERICLTPVVRLGKSPYPLQ